MREFICWGRFVSWKFKGHACQKRKVGGISEKEYRLPGAFLKVPKEDEEKALRNRVWAAFCGWKR